MAGHTSYKSGECVEPSYCPDRLEKPLNKTSTSSQLPASRASKNLSTSLGTALLARRASRRTNSRRDRANCFTLPATISSAVSTPLPFDVRRSSEPPTSDELPPAIWLLAGSASLVGGSSPRRN